MRRSFAVVGLGGLGILVAILAEMPPAMAGGIGGLLIAGGLMRARGAPGARPDPRRRALVFFLLGIFHGTMAGAALALNPRIAVPLVLVASGFLIAGLVQLVLARRQGMT